MSDDDTLKEAKEAFQLAQDYEKENRNLAEVDLKFSRLGDQWDEKVLEERRVQGRPALTINKMPAYIRQVVNDARLNKPSIKTRPVDSGGDVQTAKIMNGLIRGIEQTSNADIAYDTAADFAVTMGFGYFLIDVDYAGDDTFDQDIRIERVANPFNVFGDPYSEAADSSDWNTGFYVTLLSKDEFERRYNGAEPVNWEGTGYTALDQTWFDGDNVLVAKWWRREEVKKSVLLLADGSVVDAEVYEERRGLFDIMNDTVVAERTVKSHKVTHYHLTGAEVLDTTPWPGRYIPLIPVYGEEVNIQGKRYFRSLIRDALDAQRQLNYWRTASTELVALAPKAPWLGPEEAFTGADARKWETANTEQHAFLGYAGDVAPTRTPFAGVPAGALQEAMNASDDMKQIMGLPDPWMGIPSNETSGKAISLRQRKGDVSTFHFRDNLNRAIRHGGRIVLDLIPHVYTGDRIIRVIGEDRTVTTAHLGSPAQPGDQNQGFEGVYDLTAGKYDLTVEAGPSYMTQRQEAAEQMMEFIRVYPDAAPVIGDLLVKNLDWDGADEIAERLKMLLPEKLRGGEDPRLAQAAQIIKGLEGSVQQLEGKLRELMGDKAVDEFKAAVDAYNAETKRIAALAKAGKDINDVNSPAGPYDRFEAA